MQPINLQPSIANYRQPSGCLEVSNISLQLRRFPPFKGNRTAHVTLYGCNLDCPACFANYSQSSEDYTPNRLVHNITNIFRSKSIAFPHQQDAVTISGGEPLRQNIIPLVSLLLEDGYTVIIETNGVSGYNLNSISPHPGLHIVCSPKTSAIDPNIEKHVTAWVYPITNGAVCKVDGLPLRPLANKMKPFRPKFKTNLAQIFVIPEYSTSELITMRNKAEAKDSAIKFGYTYSEL